MAKRLAAVRHQQGRLIGRMEGLGFTLRAEATLQTRTEEVLKSSEIEGEVLEPRASFATVFDGNCLKYVLLRLMGLAPLLGWRHRTVSRI